MNPPVTLCSGPDVVGARRIRDHFKLWRTEDWNAGLVETINLPNANITKRYVMELSVTYSTSISYDAATDLPADHILPVISQLEIETGNEDRILAQPFVFLWFKTGLHRRMPSYITPFGMVADTEYTNTVLVEIDLSDYQDFGLDADQMDQVRLNITWAAATVLGAEITVTSANLKIWYDERIRGGSIKLHPTLLTHSFQKNLDTITDGRIEIPKGYRYSRLYLRLLDGTTPIAWTDANLTRLAIDYASDIVYGAIQGNEALEWWHMAYGVPWGWANQMWTCEYSALANCPKVYHPFDLSYIVIDFIDIFNGQLSHAINSSSTDQFDLVYSFDETNITNGIMQIHYDTHYTVGDRVANPSTRLSQTIPEAAREVLLHQRAISNKPEAVLPTNLDIADIIKWARRNFTEVQLRAFLDKHPKIREMVRQFQQQRRG